MNMAAFSARSFLLNLRYTIHRVGSFTRIRLIPSTRTCFGKRGQILIQMPKVTLLCWGAVNATSFVARCQEASLAPQTTDRKSLAKVQVHKLIFFLHLSLRALVLLLKFGPLLLLYPLTVISSYWASRWLDALLWMTETSGPTFIKLGQWACTRRDVFSPDFCDRFSKLHVHVQPHSWAYTKQCLRRAFGEGWGRLFVFEGKEPIGSGCVAQVYRGWARVDSVEDLDFQSLVDKMEKEDLLEAWEIPGLGGALSSMWGLGKEWWTGQEEGEGLESRERSHLESHHGENLDKQHLIPVAIKVGVTRLVYQGHIYYTFD